MLAAATVVAHAGEEMLYVLAPLLVFLVGWWVWDRRRGVSSVEADEADEADGAVSDQGSTPPDDPHGP